MYSKPPFGNLVDTISSAMKAPSPQIYVAMLGPRGAGKTSVLTAMYDRFDAIVGRINLSMRPGSETVSLMLGERMAQLLKLVQDPDADTGIRGDMSHHAYEFAIGRRGFDKDNPSFRVIFHDYPGGWLTPSADDTEDAMSYSRVVEMVRDAAVTQIAIDTPFLMENGGKYHAERNVPKEIAGVFREAYNRRNTERLVILSPIKCEAYMRTPEDRAKLVERVKEGYSELFDVLRSGIIAPKLIVAITPVQTTGCVEFAKMVKVPGGKPPVRARFSVPAGEAIYQPCDSEQPLSYIILFAMRQYKNELVDNPIRFALSHIFRLDNHIREGFDLLAGSCKADDGFAVMGL